MEATMAYADVLELNRRQPRRNFSAPPFTGEPSAKRTEGGMSGNVTITQPPPSPSATPPP